MKRHLGIQVPVGICQPILVAQELYRKYSKVPFAMDLMDYMYTGCVVARPTCFALAKIVDLAPYENGIRIGESDPAWFVRVACGDILELLKCLPCPMPKIAFCRNGKDTMKVYNFDYFVKKVLSTYGKSRISKTVAT